MLVFFRFSGLGRMVECMLMTGPERRKKAFEIGLRAAKPLALIAIVGYVAYLVGAALVQRSYDLSQATSVAPYQTADGYACDIAVIPLVGQLWASKADAEAQTNTDSSDNISAEEVLQQLEQAAHDDSIKGVVLRVDSPGGSPVGGEMIANALKRLGKPSVAVILDSGDSAAYFAATGADEIIASPLSDVGDIGVTMSYLDQSRQNAQNGLTFEKISAGTYKDVGNPNLALTAADRAYLQANVDNSYEVLIGEIANNRGLATSTVRQLANGASLTGQNALHTGLIDALGDTATAQAWFEKQFKGDVTLCE